MCSRAENKSSALLLVGREESTLPLLPLTPSFPPSLGPSPPPTKAHPLPVPLCFQTKRTPAQPLCTVLNCECLLGQAPSPPPPRLRVPPPGPAVRCQAAAAASPTWGPVVLTLPCVMRWSLLWPTQCTQPPGRFPGSSPNRPAVRLSATPDIQLITA